MCVADYQRDYRKKNREKIIQQSREYVANHREEARKRTKQWINDNSDKKQQSDKQYYKRNRKRELEKSKHRYQQNKERDKQRAKEWRETNTDRVAANLAKRRANKKQATPVWADLKKIQVFYTDAKSLTERTGVEYQVDHIVPLNSDIVCGLHCEHNLQVITAEENNSKNNRLLEELF